MREFVLIKSEPNFQQKIEDSVTRPTFNVDNEAVSMLVSEDALVKRLVRMGVFKGNLRRDCKLGQG